MPFLTQIGNNSARQLAPEHQFDPELGYTEIEVWEGSERGLLAVAAQYAAAKFRYRIFQKDDGPTWRAEFSRTPTEAEGADEVIDEWEFDRDYGQEDLRHSPKVINAFGGSTADLAEAFNLIEDELKKSEQTLVPTPGVIALMYDNMARGQTSYQSYNVVLRRVRTIPIQYAGAAVQEAIPSVYSRDALIHGFDIPPGIASRMPDAPVNYTPPSTQWGWLQRQDQTKFLPRRGRAQESREWVFAAWSELTYDFVI